MRVNSKINRYTPGTLTGLSRRNFFIKWLLSLTISSWYLLEPVANVGEENFPIFDVGKFMGII